MIYPQHIAKSFATTYFSTLALIHSVKERQMGIL